MDNKNSMQKQEKHISPQGQIEINEILEHIGPLGKWQCIQSFFLICMGAMGGIGGVLFAITGFVPNHRCLIPQCESLNSTNYNFMESWNYTYQSYDMPEKSCSRLEFDGNCEKFLTHQYSNDLSSETIVTCPKSELVYDQSVVTSSITEDFGMVCEDSYQKALFIALFALGRLMGSFVIGFISDSYGRLKAVIFSVFVICLSGIAEAFVYNKIILAILRVIYGIGGQGIVLASFVLAAESTLPKYSVVITTLPGIGFHIGEFLLACVAYFIRDWKALQLSVHIPTLLLVGSYFIVPESVRWLNSREKYDEVVKRLNKRAAVNKKLPIPEELLHPACKNHQKFPARKLGMKAALFEIMMNGKLCRQSLNIYFQTFISFFGYYGTLYAATTLSGDPHVNFILSLVCGIPGTFLYLLLPDRIGRKATLIMSELVLGISCMVGIFLQYYELYPIAQIICSMAGRLVAGVAIKTCLIFMAEVFHTPIRSTAVSIGAACGGFGVILGFLMEVLEVFWKPLPGVIIGTACILGAILVFALPETKGRKLPETIDDVLKTVQE